MAGGITPLTKWARNNARIRNEYVTGFIGEFLGNLVLCLFAVGAVSSLLIHAHGYMVAVLGGVLGIMIAVTVFGGLSGAHLNPAVSFGLAITGELSWFKLPVYWIAQFIGSYVGAGLGYSLYEHRLRRKCYEDSYCKTPMCEGSDADNDIYLKYIIGIFSPVPSETPVATAFADQVVTTAVLLAAVMSAIDRRNMKVPPYFFGLFFALVVAAIAFAFGVNAGGSMNPARDLGPRLMAISIGCKSEDVFKSHIAGDDPTGPKNNHYWLAPFLGPMLGSVIGSLVYVFLVGSHLPDAEDEKKKSAPVQGDVDWRSTVFLPKANQPSGPQNNNGYGVGPPYVNGVTNGGLISPQNGGPYGAGVQNTGYLRDAPSQNL